MTNFTSQQIKEETHKVFYTNKINNIYLTLIPEFEDFNLEKYKDVLIHTYRMFQKEQITFEEFISVGGRLQVRKLPKKGLGAFDKYNLFTLLELCNSLEYEYFYSPENYEKTKNVLIEQMNEYVEG